MVTLRTFEGKIALRFCKSKGSLVTSILNIFIDTYIFFQVHSSYVFERFVLKPRLIIEISLQ